MDDELKRLLEQGRAAFAQKDYQRALTLFSEVIKLSGSFADVHNMLGMIFHRQGNYPAARNAFKRSLEINPDFAEPAMNLMVTLNDMGVPQEERRQEFDRLGVAVPQRGALDDFLKSKLANMYYDIGRIWDSVDKYDQAVDEYKRALKLKPEYHDIRLALAGAYRKMDQVRDAIAECHAILTRKASYVAARNLLGLCFHIQGEEDKAIAEWGKVITEDPDNRLAKVYLASVEGTSTKDDLDDVT